MDTDCTHRDPDATPDKWSRTPSRLSVWLPDRIMRRLRARALDRGQTAEHFAALALAAVAVPHAAERARLAFRFLHGEGLGSLIRVPKR